MESGLREIKVRKKDGHEMKNKCMYSAGKGKVL